MKNTEVESINARKDEIARLKKELEQKNRELEIEAALERVRARTMAMQKSSELAEAAQLLYQQFHLLGINTFTCAYMFIEEENNIQRGWAVAADGKLMPDFFVFPLKGDTVLDARFESWKNKQPLHEAEIHGEANKLHHEFIVSIQPPEFADLIVNLLPDQVFFYNANFTYGYLFIVNTVPFNIQEKEIAIRFAKVFEQTYTRFLDLKKAEAQAREAQIEAALERVRSKTIAMHNSTDVGDTVVTMFAELVKLGIQSNRCGIVIFNESTVSEIWTAKSTSGDNNSLVIGYLDTTIHPLLNNVRLAWGKKDSFFSFKMEGEYLQEYYQTINNYREYPTTFNLNSLPEQETLSDFFFPEGAIFAFTNEPLKTKDTIIFKRFAGVFGQTYRRYLDLKKAEKQAREAYIETSLERVRSRTMGMQKSSELQEVINRIFVEMTGLGVQMDSSYIITHLDEDINKGFYAWVSINEQSYASSLHQAYLDHPVVHRFYKAWNEKEPHFAAIYSKAEKNRYFRYQFKYSPQLSQIPEQRKKVILDGNGWSLSWAILKNAAIIIQRYHNQPFTEDEINIQKRFAKVFEQTYTRFLDLQKAEEQARDALKQASLDRVRGEIASMRNSEDLSRITPVIWRELKALEVPFFRCGVFIFDESVEKVGVYLSTPEGMAIAALNLSFDANELTKNTVEHWRKKRIFRTHWNREDFVNWTRSMMKLGQVGSAESYQGAADAPESLNLHFVPFRQGMLYVGDGNPLTNDKIDLVKTLAEAFSIAYARYEDFKHLEEAKNKIEITLTELKAAQSQLVQAEKMASLGELTAGIAHEIQNPLNFVNNFSEVSNELMDEMKEELATGNWQSATEIADDIKQNLEKINHHGKRAESIVKGMLLHSRSNSGQKELTDINALCDEYLRLSYHGFRAKDKSFNADFKLEADETLPKIEVVPQDIGRVFLNLINNAFYAAPLPPEVGFKDPNCEHKPLVIVKTSYLPPSGGMRGACLVSVSDNGPGIPSSIKDKIFQPFFTTKPTGQGTGLGLSLSYDIVKAHGGELKVESKEGEGTTFIVSLYI